MATVTKKRVKAGVAQGCVPYGNQRVLPYYFETNSSGVFVDSDTKTAVGATDKVRLGVIPAGTLIQDSLAIISDGFRATVTADIGFEYVDGVDDSDVPQDVDYFNNSLDLATAGRTRLGNTGVKPVRLPKDAYLILTNEVAAHNAAGRLDFIVYGIDTGTP